MTVVDDYMNGQLIINGGDYVIRKTLGGAYTGDYEICGPDGFYYDGYLSQDEALRKLEDLLENR